MAARAMIAASVADASPELAAYLEGSQVWLKAASTELAQMAGGHLGPIGGAIAATAAIQLAWSRYWSAKEAASQEPDPRVVDMALRFGDQARLNLTAAYELAIRIAKAGKVSRGDPLDRVSAPRAAEMPEPDNEDSAEGLERNPLAADLGSPPHVKDTPGQE